MTSYLLRRLLWTIPVLWVAATLVWFFMFLIPGDPARILAGQNADEQVLRLVRAEWGLNQPATTRYVKYLWKLAQLDLGFSYEQHRPVLTILLEGFVKTAILSLAAMILALPLGIGLGLLSAARPGGAGDLGSRLLSTASISMPTFWLGLTLMLVFGVRLGWLPISGYGDSGTVLGVGLPGAANLALPALTLAIFSSGLLARVTRATLLEESSQEYARAARARGASAGRTLSRHVLANALLPILTVAGLNFGTLLGGAVATETIFAWPGLGRVIVRGLTNRDLPVVEGGAMLLTAAFLLVTLVTDLCCAAADPRTRD